MRNFKVTKEKINNSAGYCKHCGCELRHSLTEPGKVTDMWGYYGCKVNTHPGDYPLHEADNKSENFNSLYDKLNG